MNNVSLLCSKIYCALTWLLFQRLRDKFIFKVIPMLNPDGVIVGNYRWVVIEKSYNLRKQSIVEYLSNREIEIIVLPFWKWDESRKKEPGECRSNIGISKPWTSCIKSSFKKCEKKISWLPPEISAFCDVTKMPKAALVAFLLDVWNKLNVTLL